MQHYRSAGLALIGGTLAGMVTMAFHPTGPALMTDFDRMAPVNQGVHALAIAGTIATVFGLIELTRLLERRRSLSVAALVSYSFGAVAVMFAAIASGFIGTALTAQVLESGPGAREAFEPLFDYNWFFNQASTRVFVLTASLGIALWSAVMLRDSRFGRGLGITGLIVGAAAAIATVTGLPLDIHGFGAIVLGHGVWMIWTGARLLKIAGASGPGNDGG